MTGTDNIDTLTTHEEPAWSWSYGSWIYNYLCNQCLSPLTLWVRILLRQGVLDTTKLALEIKSSAEGLAGGPEKRFWDILKPHSAIVLRSYFLQNNGEICTVWKEFDRHMIMARNHGQCTLRMR